MLDKIEFGNYLFKLRKAAGLNQEELAERAGVHLNTISQWENGVYIPKTPKLKKLAEALNVTETDLLNGPVKQEFEVKIIMGVKNLPNATGMEVKENTCTYGIDETKPLIHMALNNADIGTPEKRKDVFKKLVAGFLKACWMNDHRDEAEPEMPDVSAILSMIQPV